MFIDFISIVSDDGAELRRVYFHQGVNLVVDSNSSSKHNRVGKTTFLRLIDILLGANNKNLIYKDAITNNTNKTLEAFIKDNRIAIEGKLSSELPSTDSSRTVFLHVDLFPNGHYSIDGKRLPKREYHRQLSKNLFGSDNIGLSFRQLINSFLRISLGGDDDSFLRFIPGDGTSHKIYRAAYNYLLGISDPTNAKKLDDATSELTKIGESEKRYQNLVSKESPEELNQIIDALNNEAADVKRKLDDIIDANEFAKNREKIVETRRQYEDISDKISDVDYLIMQNEIALKQAKAERARKVNSELAHDFFKEVKNLIPEVDKKFDEMLEFNEQLSQNKIDYFTEVIADFSEKKKKLVENRDRLTEGDARYLSIIKKQQVDEYTQLSQDYAGLRQRVGENEEILRTIKAYEADKIDNEKEAKRLKKIIDEEQSGYESIVGDFNNHYFTSVAERINGEKPILVYEPDVKKFPVKIDHLYEGTSTGTRKSLIAAYDIAYQQYARSRKIQVPEFVVHDVIESVEGPDLRATLVEAKKQPSQYIVATLKEKLDSSGITENDQAEMTILTLSQDDRLFEGSKDKSTLF